MEFPIITAQAAVVLALLQTFLMMRTGLFRAKTKIGVGDGGNDDMMRRMRAHGNLAENSSLVLILIALNEFAGSSTAILFPVAITFVVLRFSHAAGISKTTGPNPFRVVGALGTAAMTVTLVVLLAKNISWAM